MLLSWKHEFIYLKTHKTASTTVQAYLEPYCLPPGVELDQIDSHESVTEFGIVGARGRKSHDLSSDQRFDNHMRAKLIKKAVGRDTFFAMRRICCVRNPFERMVSAFAHAEKAYAKPWYSDADRIVAFREWLVSSPKPRRDLEVYMIDGEPVATHFVRFEHLHDDMAQLCTDLGLPAFEPSRLGHLIDRPKRRAAFIDKSIYYDAKSRAVVEELFEWEIATFGYSFAQLEKEDDGHVAQDT